MVGWLARRRRARDLSVGRLWARLGGSGQCWTLHDGVQLFLDVLQLLLHLSFGVVELPPGLVLASGLFELLSGFYGAAARTLDSMDSRNGPVNSVVILGRPVFGRLIRTSPALKITNSD